MKMSKRIILVAVGLMVAAVAQAQTSEGDTPPAKPIAGYDNGFFIQNPEGDYRMTIKGRLQPEYFFQQGKQNTSLTNTFKVRRAQVNFSGNLGQHWSYFALFQNSTSSSAVPAVASPTGSLFWLGSVTYSPGTYFSMEMGTVSPFFDRLSMESSGVFMFAESPLVATQMDGIQDLSISRPAFGFDTAPGINISGNIKNKFLYGVSISNGSNPNGNSTFTSNYNRRMNGTMRLQYNILKDPGYAESDLAWSETPAFDVAVGGGYMDQGSTDAYSNNTIYFRYNWQGVIDTTFKYKGLSLIGAYYGRIQYCSQTGSNARFTLQDVGYYAQAGYFIVPKKVEIAGRAAQLFHEGPLNDSSEFDGTINWYIIGNSVKWQNTLGWVNSYDNVAATPAGEHVLRFWSMITMNI